MARNEEKALTLFNKWQTFKHDYHASVGNRRPLLASECESLPEAEKWRRELVRDVTKKISAIHNASLGEHRIREINDEINKMMRQKHYWETRVRELGGDSGKNRQNLDVEGKELPGAPGYRYYGAAKDLPGVRELFAERDDEVESRKQKSRSRGDIYRYITPDYYGYRDDDDGVLAPKELEQENILFETAYDAFVAQKKSSAAAARQAGVNLEVESSEEDEEEEEHLNVGIDSRICLSGVDKNGVPSQQEVDQVLVERKRRQLLDKMNLL